MSCCCAERKIVHTGNGPKAIGPYSLGVQAGHLVFTAGQVTLAVLQGSGAVVKGIVAGAKRAALRVSGR